MKSYQDYTTEDFLLDESFVAWVNRSDSDKEIRFWDSFLREYPKQYDNLMEARHIITSFDFNTSGRPTEVVAQIKKNIDDNIGYENQMYVFSGATKWHLPFAAALALLLVSIAVYLWQRPDDRYLTATTNYGETREVSLPDGSKVTLNANSELRYSSFAEDDTHREVWLDGEAFFSVTHTTDDKKFLVHTSSLTVEVLGTKFNVNNRRGKTSVVLSSGKVKLAIPSQSDTSSVTMQPGERVQYEDLKITQEVVNTEVYTAWQKHQLIFDRTTLQEIAEVLEDEYGYKVIIESKNLSQREISATKAISIENLETLLEIISKMYQVTLKKDGNTLRVKDT